MSLTRHAAAAVRLGRQPFPGTTEESSAIAVSSDATVAILTAAARAYPLGLQPACRLADHRRLCADSDAD
jgi:hypothetical protein